MVADYLELFEGTESESVRHFSVVCEAFRITVLSVYIFHGNGPYFISYETI